MLGGLLDTNVNMFNHVHSFPNVDIRTYYISFLTSATYDLRHTMENIGVQHNLCKVHVYFKQFIYR